MGRSAGEVVVKFVLLWTDLALWLMAAAVLFYAWRVNGQANLRMTWRRVLRDPVAASAGVVMTLFLLVTLVDSVHLRRALPSAPGAATVYDTRTLSALDLLLERQIRMREVSYSLPLGTHGFNKESVVDAQGGVRRDYPRLKFGGAHLGDPAAQWSGDVTRRVLLGLAAGLALAAGLVALTTAALARHHHGWRQALADLAADRSFYPWRAILLTTCWCWR
jgi:peptide/nickel transport system permease protein